jgi:uncharacterized protein
MGERTSYPPGTISWAELMTRDADAAADFYGKLFGWTTEEIPDADGYRVIRDGDRANGAIVQYETHAGWMPYFGHADAERLTEEIGDLGGKLYNGPMQMPQGTIAVMADPQGAAFAVWTGQYED